MNSHPYQKIEKAIQYLNEFALEQPNLEKVAALVGLSPFHFQKLFTNWAGVSPKKFTQFLTAKYAKQKLRENSSVLDASLYSGLSGPSRLHDLLITVDAVTPGEYKSLGRNLTIEYAMQDSPFGKCLIATTPRGICWVSFLTSDVQKEILSLQTHWPEAKFVKMKKLGFDPFTSKRLQLLLKGSPFQIKVWEALLKLPMGSLSSYGEIAQSIGKPRAARAIGSAVAKNQIAYLIPCHRVIKDSGIIGEYRWGSTRKQAMIALEASTLLTRDQ